MHCRQREGAVAVCVYECPKQRQGGVRLGNKIEEYDKGINTRGVEPGYGLQR
jgi:hypothetical protein